MNSYDIGDLIRLRGSFTNSAGAAVDPSSVTLQYRQLSVDPTSYTTLIYGVNSIDAVKEEEVDITDEKVEIKKRRLNK